MLIGACNSDVTNSRLQAYKGLSANKDKIEAALEKQQDKTASRQRELAEMHKKDMAVKDRLVEALQRKIKDNDDLADESAKRMDARQL